MLVLSRQRDETIMIGDDIEITVVDIRGDKIRLGIDAPSDIAVHRKEVYEAIRRENEQAAQMDVSEIGQFRINPGTTKQVESNDRRASNKSAAARVRAASARKGIRPKRARPNDSTQCSSKTA